MAAAKVAVLGAGSVGCFIGGAWGAAGLPVTLIGRPRIAHDIRDHGLTLTDFTAWKAPKDLEMFRTSMLKRSSLFVGCD